VLLAILIFVAALAVIASDRVHRTKVALLAAALVVLTGVLEQEQAIESIDFNTIGLLAGMMVVVRQTEKTGLYDYIAVRAGQISGGTPFGLVLALGGVAAVLSPFLDNLTVILLIVPITFVIADTLDINPLPLVIVEVMASNIGGTATLIGDPPNIIIAGATGLSFMDFVRNLAPIVVVTLIVILPGLYLFYRRDLEAAPEKRDRLLALDARASIRDPALLRRLSPVLVGTLLAFFVHQAVHLEPATVALTGATIMLLLSPQPIEDALEEIEWSTLFFFVALFVVVGGLEETGALEKVARGITDVTGDSFPANVLAITWVSAFASAAVDNIPFTTAMIPVVQEVQTITGNDSDTFWWALALGADFGGNGTLIGAAANVAAAGLAERSGYPISFLSFLKVGFAVMICSVLLATAYLALFYL
jgi:Na+/H+ antiporter NhaD/arsenite permease-like protein